MPVSASQMQGIKASSTMPGLASSLPMLWLLTWWFFLRVLTVGTDVSLTLWPAVGTLFLLLAHLLQPQYEVFGLVLLNLVLS